MPCYSMVWGTRVLLPVAWLWHICIGFGFRFQFRTSIGTAIGLGSRQSWQTQKVKPQTRKKQKQINKTRKWVVEVTKLFQPWCSFNMTYGIAKVYSNLGCWTPWVSNHEVGRCASRIILPRTDIFIHPPIHTYIHTWKETKGRNNWTSHSQPSPGVIYIHKVTERRK